MRASITTPFMLYALCFLFYGCKAEPRNYAAVDAYYQYDFAAAREALRRDAMTINDEQTILNNARLGMASLADGDLDEAEVTLGRSFELLSTAGLNKDRTVGAILDHEGVRIWKGEPFEQALTYHYVALLYALRGDWENTRAAAANALFRLTDFGKDQDAENLARNAARDEDYLEDGYTAVDTNFALGFLMEAIGSDLAGTSGAKEQFDAALKINKDLEPIVDRLRARDYDTLLVVDYGKGPSKQAYGPDQALVHFVPIDSAHGQLIVTADGMPLAKANPVCDVNAMAVDHRWNNLEDIRRAKSMIGNVLLAGGAFTTAYGAHRRDSGTALAGVGAMALGLLTKSGARADTRHCEFMPVSIFLVPLTLERTREVRVEIGGRPAAAILLNNVQPGSPSKPEMIYLRLFQNAPLTTTGRSWLMSRREIYSNDFTGVLHGPHGYPWILGGRDVSTPTRQTLEEYQANGYLRDFTLTDLEDLYRAEGILIGSGAEMRPDALKNPSFRHILEGGVGLFTPRPHSMGYKRNMCTRQPPYQPRSDLVRNCAASIRVTKQEDATDESNP